MQTDPIHNEILAYIARHRFVTIRDLSHGLGLSKNTLTSPLTVLLGRRYISREELSRRGLKGGRTPFVYRIERQGILQLKRTGILHSIPIQHQQYHAKNESKSHALLITGFQAMAESSMREHRDRSFLDEFQIKQQIYGTPKQLTWPVTVNFKNKEATFRVIPDAVFGKLNETDDSVEYFFLEADRGTMPINPKTSDRSSLAKKVAAYHASYQRQLCTHHLGLPGFRVIFVVPTRARLLSLVSLCSQFRNGRGIFLLVDEKTYHDHHNLFDIPFISGSGRTRYIT